MLRDYGWLALTCCGRSGVLLRLESVLRTGVVGHLAKMFVTCWIWRTLRLIIRVQKLENLDLTSMTLKLVLMFRYFTKEGIDATNGWLQKDTVRICFEKSAARNLNTHWQKLGKNLNDGFEVGYPRRHQLWALLLSAENFSLPRLRPFGVDKMYLARHVGELVGHNDESWIGIWMKNYKRHQTDDDNTTFVQIGIQRHSIWWITHVVLVSVE